MWSLTQSVNKILILSICSLVIFKSTRSEPLSHNEPLSHSAPTENLEQSSLAYGIFKDIVRNEESECVEDVKLILDGIQNKDVWALKSKPHCLRIIE